MLFLMLPVTSIIIIYQLAELTWLVQNAIFYKLYMISAFLMVLVNLIGGWFFNNLTKLERWEQVSDIANSLCWAATRILFEHNREEQEDSLLYHDLRNNLDIIRNLWRGTSIVLGWNVGSGHYETAIYYKWDRFRYYSKFDSRASFCLRNNTWFRGIYYGW